MILSQLFASFKVKNVSFYMILISYFVFDHNHFAADGV